jgi:peptidoglycan hydrolase CwlO-like protein
MNSDYERHQLQTEIKRLTVAIASTQKRIDELTNKINNLKENSNGSK